MLMETTAAVRQIWSASPTPFTENREIDLESVAKMVEHHVRLGVDGLFLAGTCGEGPWMTDRQKLTLVQAVREAAAGRLRLAVQVTDNSSARVLEQVDALQGVDFVIVAQPYLAMNVTPAQLAPTRTTSPGLTPISRVTDLISSNLSSGVCRRSQTICR